MVFINTIFVSAIATLVASFPFAERNRRDPSGRAMTWSGWMPGGGMTVFASSADDMWSQSGLTPPLSTWQDQGYNWRNHQEPVERKLFQETDTTTIKPFDDEDNFKLPRRPFDDDRDRRQFHKPRKYDDDDDRRYSGSNANASFNAWFPIMLGMYPAEGNKSTKSHNYGEQDPDGRSLAAIANSVNHGRSGVASSHAVVYTGQPRYNHKTY